MDNILVLSILIFFGSLVYLVYHLIRKIKNRERVLPKKIFYPTLIGSFLLSVIVSPSTDTSVQDALDEALAENIILVTENKEVKSTNKTLEDANSKLTEENEKATGKIEELTAKLADFEIFEQELADEKQAHQENTEALQNEIAGLKETNTSLASEVENLKGQVASANEKATATANTSSNVNSSGGESSSDHNEASSPLPVETPKAEENVYYKNCTAARNAGAAPVRRGNPGYASHLDRDGDGIGCE